MAAVCIALGATVLFAAELGRIQIEDSLSRFFKIPVRIERLTFTPRRLTLHNVCLEPKRSRFNSADEHSLPVLLIDQLQIEGSIFSVLSGRSFGSWWAGGGLESVQVTRLTFSVGGVPVQAQGRIFLTGSSTGPTRCEGWLTLQHPILGGRVEVSGTALKPVLFGWFGNGDSGTRAHFVSSWRISGEGIRCLQMQIQDGWLLQGGLQRDLPDPSRPAAASFNGFFTFKKGDERFELLFSSLSSSSGNAIFRLYREEQLPREMEAQWKVRQSDLEFKGTLMGGQAFLSGHLNLEAPYPVTMALNLKGVVMEEVAKWVLPARRVPALSGRLHGTVTLSGPLNQIISEGEISARSFTLGHDQFDYGVIRFRGQGSMLEVHNSQMNRETGIVLVDGRVDLRRLGKQGFLSSIKMSSLENGVGWAGWRMTQGVSSSGLRLGKVGSDGKVSVGFNYQMDTGVGPEPKERQGVEVGLPITSQQKVSIRLNKEEEFVGVEHRQRF